MKSYGFGDMYKNRARTTFVEQGPGARSNNLDHIRIGHLSSQLRAHLAGHDEGQRVRKSPLERGVPRRATLADPHHPLLGVNYWNLNLATGMSN